MQDSSANKVLKSLKVDRDLHRTLKAASVEAGVSLEAYIEKALRAYLAAAGSDNQPVPNSDTPPLAPTGHIVSLLTEGVTYVTIPKEILVKLLVASEELGAVLSRNSPSAVHGSGVARSGESLANAIASAQGALEEPEPGEDDSPPAEGKDSGIRGPGRRRTGSDG